MNRTLFVALLFLVGCADSGKAPVEQSPTTSDANAVAQPVESKPTTSLKIVDDAGRTLLFSKTPRRILSLSPANTELVFAVGAGDLLVGRTTQCDYPAKATEISAVGSLFPPDYERIVGVRPDIILMTGGSEDVRSRLEARGLKVLVIEPKGVVQVAEALRLLGRVLDRGDTAEVAAKTYENALANERVSNNKDPVRVFYEVWPSPLTAAGPRSFVGDLINVAGGLNVVTSKTPWPRPSAEKILAADPEVIIVARAQDRASLLDGKRPGWSAVTAVKHGHVFVPPDPSVLVRPGPRLIEGVRWLKAKFAETQR